MNQLLKVVLTQLNLAKIKKKKLKRLESMQNGRKQLFSSP